MSARAPGRAAAALLAAALLGAAPAPAAATPPTIAFESETCDLGGIVQGERPECVFAFRNAGTEDLRILAVEPTCGCTTAHPVVPLLRAGERGTLQVIFDSEEFAGEVVKEVEVRSTDPARPAVTLRIASVVEPEVQFEPALVTFDPVQAGAELLQAVTLTNRRAEPVRVLSVASRPHAVRCSLPSWTEPAQPLTLESWDRAVLEVRLSSPQRLVMPLAGECVLQIEGPRRRSFRLKILAYPAP